MVESEWVIQISTRELKLNISPQVRSELGKGALFEFFIEAFPVDTAVPVPESPKASPMPARTAQRSYQFVICFAGGYMRSNLPCNSVLITEDNIINQVIILSPLNRCAMS